MKKGKYEAAAPAKRRGNKSIALLLALFLLIGTVVGGTLAWLIDSTNTVEDTFTYGDINIKLTEGQTDNAWSASTHGTDAINLKMVPGKEATFNPYVKVEANSEACYLFVEVACTKGEVKVGETNYKFADFVDLDIKDSWTKLNGVNNVYYQTVSSSNSAQWFAVETNDEIEVPNTVTKAMLTALGTDNKPTVSIKAYAIQSENLETSTAEGAWAAMQAQLPTNP